MISDTMKNHKKEIILTLLNVILGYQVVYPLIISIFVLSIFVQNNLSINDDQFSILITSICSVVALIIQVWISYDTLTEQWKWFGNTSKRLKRHLKTIGIGLLIMYGTNILFNALYSVIGISDTSTNQSLIENMFVQYPYAIIVMTCIAAPVLEEMAFRYSIYEPLRKKNVVLGYVVSSFLFGFMHALAGFVDSGITFNEVLYIFQYGAMGAIFAWTYTKTNSIWGSILLHALSNGIAVLALFLTL